MNGELWVPLIEKAWAKFNGNYQIMEMQSVEKVYSEILNWRPQYFSVSAAPINNDALNLLNKLTEIQDSNIPLILKTKSNSNSELNYLGLKDGSYYNLLSIHYIQQLDPLFGMTISETTLLRIKSTIKDDSLYNGTWNDLDDLSWNQDYILANYSNLQVNDTQDGTFYTDINEFIQVLDMLIIPNISSSVYNNSGKSLLYQQDIQDLTWNTYSFTIDQNNLVSGQTYIQDAKIGIEWFSEEYYTYDTCRSNSENSEQQYSKGLLKIYKQIGSKYESLGFKYIDEKQSSFYYIQVDKLYPGTYQIWYKPQWGLQQIRDYFIKILSLNNDLQVTITRLEFTDQLEQTNQINVIDQSIAFQSTLNISQFDSYR
eukprot:403331626